MTAARLIATWTLRELGRGRLTRAMQAFRRLYEGFHGAVDRATVLRLTGACALAGGTIGGAGMWLRQRSFREHTVFKAACEQLQDAAAVRELLGEGPVSTAWTVGGYFDSLGGTTVFEISLTGAGGAKAIARVEAEAEWVGAHGGATVTSSAMEQKYASRWLLRHLELQPEARRESPIVLYSTPPIMPLPPFAPSREPRWLPHSIGGLFPNLKGDTFAYQLMIGGAIVLTAQAMLYARFRYNDGAARAAERVQELMAVHGGEALAAIRAEAIRAVSAGVKMAPAEKAKFYGRVSTEYVAALTPIVHANASRPTPRDLLFAAEKSAGGKGGWRLTHASLSDLRTKTNKLAPLAHLPDDEAAEGARDAVEQMVAEAGSVAIPSTTPMAGTARVRPRGRRGSRGGQTPSQNQKGG